MHYCNIVIQMHFNLGYVECLGHGTGVCQIYISVCTADIQTCKQLISEKCEKRTRVHLGREKLS